VTPRSASIDTIMIVLATPNAMVCPNMPGSRNSM
jgi:hypothetical protein